MNALFGLLFGCSHRRITRPITPVRKGTADKPETYVVCLDCGTHFAYDLKEMRVGKAVAIPFVAFKGLDRAATAHVKEIRIFGDGKDTFWIGEIRTTTDDEPINVEFPVKLDRAGAQPITISVAPQPGEATAENNSVTRPVDLNPNMVAISL